MQDGFNCPEIQIRLQQLMHIRMQPRSLALTTLVHRFEAVTIAVVAVPMLFSSSTERLGCKTGSIVRKFNSNLIQFNH